MIAIKKPLARLMLNSEENWNPLRRFMQRADGDKDLAVRSYRLQ
jgi:hypothetical protein